MRNFPSLAVAAFLAALSVPNASAYLWETQAQIEKRYGPPIKITGYPDKRAFTYAVQGLKIKIKFLNGVSGEETYSRSPGDVFGDSEVQRLLEANGRGAKWRQQQNDEWVIETQGGRAHAAYDPGSTLSTLVVYTHEYAERDWDDPIGRTGKEETFEGVATLKQDDKTTSGTIHSGGRVVYIPWSDEWRDRGLRGLFTSGKTYRITLRDEWVLDDDEPWAFVSDRDHKDYHDTVNDSKCYVLMRVEKDGAVIFDRSVCEVHHVKMSEIKAKVGTSAPLPGEAECERKFPHYRDFLKIMCIADGTEQASLYVCPECVAACKRLTDPNR
ncbi:MAG: hypothetical protein WAO00_02650 [Chthoniobacterales bacterium]